jgi:hypothetical protein
VREIAFRSCAKRYTLQIRRITHVFGWIYAIEVPHIKFLGRFWKFEEKCYFCLMTLYATNTQFNTLFWVDMRYGVAYINELATMRKKTRNYSSN